MGILESLAGGLKGAGGVLSPGVFKANVEEDAAQGAERRKMELMQLQEQMNAAKEKMLSDAVAPALMNGDFEGAAAAAAKSGAPGGSKLAMELLGKSEERKTRVMLADQALETKRLAMQQAHEEKMSRLLTEEARAAETKRHNIALEAVRAREVEFSGALRQMGFDLQRERGERQAQQQLNTQVQKLGGALEKSGLPEMDSVLGAVESALAKRPDIAEFISGPKSLIPDMALPNDVAAGKQAFSKLFNITLKNRSGAAVTNQELERLKQEFAAGAFKTPDQLRTAVTQARNIINKHYASVASGFGREALDAYNENVRGFGGRVVLDPSEKTEDPLGIR
jgi:uncharacterized membrane protein YkoI